MSSKVCFYRIVQFYQVIYESPPKVPSAPPVPLLMVMKVSLPLPKIYCDSKNSRSAEKRKQSTLTSIRLPEKARMKTPVAMVAASPTIYLPCTPSTLPELFKNCSNPNQKQIERFSFVGSKFGDIQPGEIIFRNGISGLGFICALF